MLGARRLLPLAVSAAVVLAGCGDDGSGSTGQEQAPATAGSSDAGLHHIHGLGVSGDTLMIATHTGLWTVPAGDTTPHRFGSSRQDIMGFSVVGDEHFIGSGHPDPSQTDMPPNLGLIESRDGGRTWSSVSLLGKADFHVLESAGRRVYGVNSGDGALLASADGGRSWEKRTPPGAVFALAIDPRSPQSLVASTDRGVFASPDGGEGWRPARDDLAGLLAWPSPERLVMVGGDGTVMVSGDGGGTWRRVGNVDGQPAAFIADGDDLYAALSDGTVKRSLDGGRSWTVRAAP